ncbi:hypothetical protein OAD85_08320 [Actinomycetota bacterium]|nr:hypothetical protein [Actinomycetota bacterium]
MDAIEDEVTKNALDIATLLGLVAHLTTRVSTLEENQIGYGSQIKNLEKHTHNYDGDIMIDIYPFTNDNNPPF